MKYKLKLDAILDYTMMSILAGDLYLIDADDLKSHLCKMVMENYFFIENNTKIVIPVLVAIKIDDVYDWCVQIGIANLETETIVFYDKYFRNNGEKISYKDGIITVHNERHEFVKTDFLDILTVPIKQTKKFEIMPKPA